MDSGKEKLYLVYSCENLCYAPTHPVALYADKQKAEEFVKTANSEINKYEDYIQDISDDTTDLFHRLSDERIKELDEDLYNRMRIGDDGGEITENDIELINEYEDDMFNSSGILKDFCERHNISEEDTKKLLDWQSYYKDYIYGSKPERFYVSEKPIEVIR